MGVRVLLFTYITALSCLSRGTWGQSQQCSCPEGCDPAAGERSHLFPNKVNVAVGRTATVSSRELASTLATGARCDPCLPVNGLWNETYDPVTFGLFNGSMHNGVNEHSCMLCDFMDYGGWWQVDLGQNYTVTELTVYAESDSSFHGMQVHVDDSLCGVLQGGINASDSNARMVNRTGVRGTDVHCSHPLSGRVVRLSKPAFSGLTSTTPDLHLCEVAVWACKAGYYGDACNLPCRGHCPVNRCHRINGFCHDACKSGYYGEDCNRTCEGHCHENTCDRISGVCLHGCADGYFGKSCTSRCGQCEGSGMCDKETGRCPSGCLFSWKGEFCNVNTHECACAEPADGGCDKVPGLSPDGVVNKENVAFGKKASMSSRYKNGRELSAPACAAVNGRTRTTFRHLNQSKPNCVHTDNSDYSPWWKVDLGRPYTVTGVTIYRRDDYHTVSRRMAGARVWVDSELCYSFPTSNNTEELDALSHKMSVLCEKPLRGQVITLSKDGDDDKHSFYIINICEFQVWVCKEGFYGEHCNETCSTNCPDHRCDNYYGTCLNGEDGEGCRPYHYGAGCTQCGHCAGGHTCDQDTGHCPQGCLLYGVRPPLCQQPCRDGSYGLDCKEECGFCEDDAPCDVNTGHCQHCHGAFLPPFCKVKTDVWDGDHSEHKDHGDHDDHLQTGLLVGGVVGGLMLVVLFAVIIVMLHCSRKQRKDQSTATNTLEMGSASPDPPPYCQHPEARTHMTRYSEATSGQENGLYVDQLGVGEEGEEEQCHPPPSPVLPAGQLANPTGTSLDPRPLEKKPKFSPH